MNPDDAPNKEQWEVLVTNLDADRFPLDRMKELCNLRWEIEKFFKTLKDDDCGIQFHSKKDEFVKMELYARYGFPGYMKNKEAFVADTGQHVKDGLVVKADTLAELAEKLGLPADKLEEAVANNNQAVIDHQDKEFGKESYRITPIKQKPYYGCILGGRILCTFDGLKINTKAGDHRQHFSPWC
ncbi:MAG: transposase [Lactobacillus equicursoris]|uniref:transposase n=1 Tax=Lactobacillus equicursoris TaxID=420645 RepID=UPI00242E70CC|nr:transposase [Lactobacillus equicursoris]MDD6408052.1 transposase [Lactobacillus equicursoris]